MHLSRTFQTMLFAPGNRLDRVRKAHASTADVICIDLEDSVPGGEKAEARTGVMTFLKEEATDRTAVRINNLRTRFGLDDLRALVDLPSRPGLVFVPMCESVAELEIIHSVLADDGVRIVPLIETAQGLAVTEDIGRAPGVDTVMFGGGDMAAQLGVDVAWEPLLPARGQFILACARAGVRAVDVPYLDVKNEAGLANETLKARAMGFVAKAAIHPAQLETIKTVLRPGRHEIERARAAIQTFREAGGRAVSFNGLMLDEPVVRRFEAILSFESEENNA